MDRTEVEAHIRSGGAAGLMTQAAALSKKDRNQVYRIGVRVIAFGKWPQSYLEDMIQLGDATIREALEDGEHDDANIMMFNMASNLCDCWRDPYVRERRHFERGLAYADGALDLRIRLQKPAEKLAMAHWARGKHLLSLSRPAEAVAAFKASVESVRKRTQAAENRDAEIGYVGFLALAEALNGQQADAMGRYRGAIAALQKLGTESAAQKDGSDLFIDQLEATREILKL